MRALVITEHGPPEVLRVQQRPDPHPGPGQARVRVRAAGVNFADLLARVGLYAELVAADAGALVRLPDGWSFAEGAALPVAYATAYAGLIRYGSLHAGERVLIHAAAGGVGVAAPQIAKLVGAEVYGTASAAKHDAIRSFGVDHPIDYRSGHVADL